MSAIDLTIGRLAGRQDGVVARWQLRSAGVSDAALDARMRDLRLNRVHRGVYAVGGPPRSRRSRRRAALLACGTGALLSHRDAAAIWGLRFRDQGAVDVTVAAVSRRQRAGIAVHVSRRLDPDDVASVDGLPVTSVARTLLDLADVVDPVGVRRAYERAERLRLLDLSALLRVIDRSNGRRGTGVLACLLDYDASAAAPTRSELERLFLDLLRAEGLPLPIVNAVIAGYEVDAYWPAARLVVELDGYEFHGGPDAFERDRRRLATLQARGLTAVALTHAQVTREVAWVTDTLRSLLRCA